MKLQRRQPEPPSQHLRQSPPPPPFASTPQRHHASHATNTTETTWTVRQLVYVAAWCFIVFCSTTLSVVADVFLDDAPAFPLLPTVVVATCAAAAAAYISALLGCCVHPAGSFQLYQPFAGGARFVTIQAFGYYILTTSQVVVLSFATGFDPNVSATHGLISITGLAALVANIMILASIFTFDPAEAKGQADHHGLVIDLLEKVSKSPNRETTLVTIFTIAQLGLCCVGEQFSWVGNVSALVVGAFHAINGYIMHFVVGYRFTPGYRLFMPCPGTKSQALAQGAAWLVYFVTLYGAGFLWYVGEAAPPIAHVALGSGCLLSSVGLILFTRLAKFHTEPTYDSVTSYGCIVLTITSTLFASVVVLLSALLMLTEVETHIRYGLEFCQMLSSFFILIITPCTNMLGKVLHGPSFHLFQPFKGGMDFVMLQAAGWACYGFALLFQTLQLSSSTNSDGTAPGTYHWIFLEAVLALMAQVFVHSSLRTFRADATDAKAHSDSPHHEVNGLRKILTVVVNGELVTAFLCAACALALRIVVDVAELRWDQTPFPRTAVLLLAVLLYACATPLAHLSGRHYGIPLFRPFDGSGMYVALQSIGWTIYALSLLMILVSWIVRDGSYDVSGGPSHLVNQRPMFVATSFGVAQLIPLVLVSISVVVESIQVSRAQKTKGFATQAFEAILRAEQVLLKADHATDVDRRRELDALIQELRTTSMSLRISASPARERFPSPAKSSATSTIEQDTDEDSTDDASRHFAVAIIIVLMSMASLAAYVSGAFWTTVMPLYGVGCATAALAIVTTSCVALHTGYGYSLHGRSGRYTYLMPFVGGTPFVLRQALGWMSYTVCAVLTIAVAIERRSNPVALVLAGVASVVAQFSILESIPCFDAKSFQHKRKTFLQSNSAALVATFTFLGSFVFAHLYGRFREQTFGVEEHDDGDATLRVARAHMVPLVVTGVSMTFAIPLTLMALRARMTNLEGSETSDGDNAGADHPLSHLGVKRRLLRDILLAVDSIVFALSLSIPAGILYIAYFLLHSLSASTRSHMSFNLTSLAHSWGIIMLVIGTLLAFSLAFPVISSGGVEVRLPAPVRRWREAFVTFQLYMIPTTASLVSYSMPLIFPGSLASLYFAIAMSCLTVAAHVKIVRTVVLRFSYVLLGYVAYQHCHDFWDAPRGILGFTFDIVTDVLLLVFWVKYESMFRNKPQESGSLRSPWFVSLFERHIIPDVERYFNVKLVMDGTRKDDGTGTPNVQDKNLLKSFDWEERVAPCLANTNNRYIFSYHPHGVFPGTALILPFTEQWRCHLGWNALHCVTVHAAGIIFNVPMVRDFLLRLGGRVVTRSALESSLEQGNSVMIVTGGQTEMLHTKYSDNEMHLVTHHHGFLKLAIKHQVPAVPLVCFAENNVMDNIHVPWLQKRMLKLIGFPFPTVPHGRWYLPLPNRTPLTVIVGSPVNPPEGISADDKEGVQRYADTYFAEVKRLFYAHRVESGYPNMELIFHGRHNDKKAAISH